MSHGDSGLHCLWGEAAAVSPHKIYPALQSYPLQEREELKKYKHPNDSIIIQDEHISSTSKEPPLSARLSLISNENERQLNNFMIGQVRLNQCICQDCRTAKSSPQCLFIGIGNLRAGMVLFYGSHQGLAGQDPVQIPVSDNIEILLDEGIEFVFLWAYNRG